MALMPNPFEFAASDAAAEQTAAPMSPAPSGAAVDLSHSDATDCPSDEAAAAHRQTDDAAADICDIGEIFVGARKLFDPDPGAYLREDELLYEVLKAMDDPHERDLAEIPAELWAEFDPAPLFLRQAV